MQRLNESHGLGQSDSESVNSELDANDLDYDSSLSLIRVLKEKRLSMIVEEESSVSDSREEAKNQRLEHHSALSSIESQLKEFK